MSDTKVSAGEHTESEESDSSSATETQSGGSQQASGHSSRSQIANVLAKKTPKSGTKETAKKTRKRKRSSTVLPTSSRKKKGQLYKAKYRPGVIPLNEIRVYQKSTRKLDQSYLSASSSDACSKLQSYTEKKIQQLNEPSQIVLLRNEAIDAKQCRLCPRPLSQPCQRCHRSGKRGKCRIEKGKCSHEFHSHCLELWIEESSNCPNCNQLWEKSSFGYEL